MASEDTWEELVRRNLWADPGCGIIEDTMAKIEETTFMIVGHHDYLTVQCVAAG